MDRPPPPTPETLRSEIAYDGGLLRVRRDEVRLPSGRRTTRQVVEHPGAVAILALTETDELLLVEQWRHPAAASLLEIPAGTREPDETALTTARRELVEEVGYTAARWRELLTFFPSPGYTNERITLFLAEGSRPVAGPHTPEADVSLVRWPVARIPALLTESSRVVDGKTLIALLWLSAQRNG